MAGRGARLVARARASIAEAARELRALLTLDPGDDIPDDSGPAHDLHFPDTAAADSVPGSALPELLELTRVLTGARRLVLWAGDAEGTLRPFLSTGRLPEAAAAIGDPLAWAVRETQPLRLDRVPRWAEGDVLAYPLRRAPGQWLVTVEAAPGTLPEPTRLELPASLIGRVIGMEAREERSRSSGDQLGRVLALLRAVPHHDHAGDPGRLAAGLARAAAVLAGVPDALVARWDGRKGGVLAVVGDAFASVAGATFGPSDGDLGLAARTGAALRRDPVEARRLPLLSEAGAGRGVFRWRRPAGRAVVPLTDAAGTVRAVLALQGDPAPEPRAVDLLHALGPVLALQLHQSADLARVRLQAARDPLTGLANRGILEERLLEERGRFDRYRRPVALLVLDLDHFKRVNDTRGHEAGDEVLRHVAGVLRDCVRDVDLVARYGGEEMVVLMPETMRREAGEVAERVRIAVEGAVVEFGGARIPVTASLGVSACPECVDHPAELVASADAALYASKEAGRNRVTVAPVRAVGDEEPSPRLAEG